MVFIIIYSIWFISEVLVNRLLRSGQDDKKHQDKGSIRIIWITILVANTSGIVIASFLSRPISNLILLPYFGLFLMIAGMIFRFISIWSLGKMFTVDVTIRDKHMIKKDGLYKLIRHPSYSGALVTFVGFGISLNNWISLIIICVPVAMAFLHRIKIEERLLIDQFGLDYINYMKKTYRLIPWIY